ncbi:MAG: hypothetical protein AVDCRST_MAG42-1547 [uncultured Chthoniobacterales bacterium]|uniref:YfhO family protein n=1 Tax=uncultured Chthoniobacterales bacterium TaxID=1836801 RepID=A0A6J4I0F6_9BACT|nr:MAG: hypothetical protein AVDCRST_MAG42-1547 [uncultured Chthoniobacterales bacterium]
MALSSSDPAEASARHSRALWREIFGAAFAGALAVVFCLILVWRHPHAFWIDDYQISILPVFADVARSWSEGTLPLLSPYSWVCGNLAGEFQYGTFSVFVNAAVVVIWKFALSFPAQAAALSITHLAVLAAGSFLLARGYGLQFPSAIMVALVGALNGWIVAWGASDWFGALAAFAWLPWSWWALEFASRQTGPRWRILLPAPFIYLLIAGGFPYTVLMLGVVTAWLTLRALVSTHDWYAPVRMAAGWVLGIGLSAPAWLSLIEMSRGSRRAAETFRPRQWLVPVDGLPGFILPAWTVEWRRFEEQISAHPALELACGFAPAVVLLIAVVMLRARFFARNAWLLGLLGFALAVCMLPGAGLFRFSFRWLPLVHLVLALAAGAALEQWLAAIRSTRVWGRHNLGFWALLMLVAIVLAMLIAGQSTSVDTTALPLWLLALASIWWAVDGTFSGQSLARQWTAAGVTFAALLMTYIDMGTSGPVARYPFQDTLNSPAPLATDRLYLSLYRSPQSNYRADQHDWSFGETVRPGSTSMFAGVHLINGYSPISPAGVGKLFDFGTHGQINPVKVDELVIPESGPDGLLAELGIDGLIVAWDFDMPDTLPKEWEIAHRWTDGYVYHRRERLEPVRVRSGQGLTGGDVRTIENSRHQVIADVTPADATRPTQLLFSRPYFPGYQARLAGAALPVSSYRGLIPTVELPAGASGRLELVYRPKPLVVGGTISLGSAIVLGASAFLLRRRPQ